jgi:hypothetical protein
MAAVMRCWVGSAGRARPDAALDRSLGSFVVAVVTEAAASAGKMLICWSFKSRFGSACRCGGS